VPRISKIEKYKLEVIAEHLYYKGYPYEKIAEVLSEIQGNKLTNMSVCRYFLNTSKNIDKNKRKKMLSKYREEYGDWKVTKNEMKKHKLREKYIKNIKTTEVNLNEVTVCKPDYILNVDIYNPWKLYRFDKDYSKLLENSCGLYFLFKEDDIKYIGSSKNISNRLREHTSKKDFDSFSILKCKKECRVALEYLYITIFNPEENSDKAYC
jgi:hypothetical protein